MFLMQFCIISKCVSFRFQFVSVVPLLLLLASLILLGKQKKKKYIIKKKKKTIQALVYVMREKRQRS